MSKERADYEIRLKDSFSSPLGGMENKMNGFERKLGSLSGSVSLFGSTLASAFAGGAAVGAVESLLSSVANIGEEAINTAREFTNMRDAIAFASGGDAEKNLKFLNDTIDRLGLNLESTNKGFKTFQGALMGTTLEGDKGRDIFTAVSEAASVMKLSAEQTEGTFLALGQMISKGNVQAEELRGQLGERLPGAFNIFARALGVSTQKLGKMLQDGEVIAEKTLPLFAAELHRTFSPGVAAAQESFNANMNRFNTFITNAKINLGNQLIPLVNEFVTIIPKMDFGPLLATVTQLKNEVFLLAGAFGDLTDAFGGTLTKAEKVNAVFQVLSGIFRALSTPIRVLIQLFTHMTNVFTASVGILEGIGTIIEGFASRNVPKMNKGIDQVRKTWSKFLSESSSDWGAFLHDEEQGWKKVFGSPKGQADKDSGFAGGFGGTGGGGKMSAADKAKAAGVEKIQSGTRNITVNINKLIETVKFETTNGQSQAQLMDMIRRTLVTAVNDANIVAQ